MILLEACDHHHHHVTQSSHSINAIGPAPLWSGRKSEHCSIMFAIITHIPSLHKILSNTPRNHLLEALLEACDERQLQMLIGLGRV
jgi:hypothetical protein